MKIMGDGRGDRRDRGGPDRDRDRHPNPQRRRSRSRSPRSQGSRQNKKHKRLEIGLDSSALQNYKI